MAAAPINYSRLKLLLILESPGALVLKHTLDSGTDNTPPRDLDDYLASLPPNSPVNYSSLKNKDNKKQFDNSQYKQIRNNPKWDNFDVTLAFRSVQLACRDMAPINDAKWNDDKELEGLLKKIKEERNCIIHERPDIRNNDFENKVNELESLFTSVINLVQVKYNVPPSDTTRVQNDVRSFVDKIKKCLDFDQIWQAGSQPLMSQFRTMGKDRLKKVFENVQFFDPLRFLSGSEGNRFPISHIFQNLRVEGKENMELNSLDVLNLTIKQPSTPSPPPPQLVVVSGEAGSGKTTLLTFIMANWVECADNFSVKHLDNYDFVLRVLCRESGADSLAKFVNPVFPEVFKAGSGIMYLLKESRVLFLIDGLDEANAESNRLVQDILNNCKSAPGFTALFTSRPERVNGFIKSLPQDLVWCKVEIMGVDPSDRPSFVLRHVASLAPDRAPDLNKKVREVMDAVGWMDHFGLPLNLLFLSNMIIEFPHRTNIYRTQTSLYVQMHDWCVEKLDYRLVKKVELDDMQRMEAIREILKKIYSVCLKGLLEGRHSLSEKDLKDLRSCCEAEKLPREEFLGAFFSQRKVIKNKVSHLHYEVPHKGIQEFFSAKFLVEQLRAGSTEKSIKELLKECLSTNTESVQQIQQQRNMLKHVAGLLSQSDETLLIKAATEVIDLLAESGVKRCNEWLSLLADTEVNENMLSRVAHHVGRSTVWRMNDVVVQITDTTVFGAAALLPRIPRANISIHLYKEISSSSEVFEVLAGHTCRELLLEHHFKNPGSTAASSSLLRRLPDTSHLKRFYGHLEPEDLALLPRGLEQLRLSVAGIPDLEKLLQALGQGENFPNLIWLGIHIPVPSVSTECLSSLTPLPCVRYVRLFLSGVGDGQVDAACRLVGAMAPRGERGYDGIFFPGASLRADGWRRLVKGLKMEQEAMWRRREEEEGEYEEEEGEGKEKKEERERKRRWMRERERLMQDVLGVGVVVPSTTITKDEETQLETLTKSLLGCRFMRWPEEDMWKLFPFY